ncbi:MAG: squalene--hopene cyclase [Nitrospirae bacterium]|nr:squalene--hopene cyclase [Nitrospirota bacterium]
MDEFVDAFTPSTTKHAGREAAPAGLTRATDHIRRYVLGVQDPVEGFWVDQLEADVTIPSDYLMLRRYLGRVDEEKERKIVRYIRSIQMEDGGWYIYKGGDSDLSATIKAYYACKLAGVSPDEPFMVKARKNVLAKGGLVNANVFTKITLAMFGQYRWDGVPCMPAEIMLFPDWLYFNLNEVSYWSRTVIVPLLIIFDKKPVFHVAPERGVSELSTIPMAALDRKRHDVRFKKEKKLLSWKNFFLHLDSVFRFYEGRKNVALRTMAISKCYRWMAERMKGEGGLGAIYPAMANSVVALKLMGHPDGDPLLEQAIKSIEDLEVDLVEEDAMYLQPCVSPIWDTAIAMNALAESGVPAGHRSLRMGADWLYKKQTSTMGDWKVKAPEAEPGGWYFQFENEFYPDTDDTSMVLLALLKADIPDEEKKLRRIKAGFDWLVALQGSDGGFGSFDKDNNKLILNHIPFADHGALLDPSTEDLAGRALEIMGLMGLDLSYPPAKAAYDYLLRTQRLDGSWYGRWGVNYIYGTWSALAGLHLIGVDMNEEFVRRSVNWLKSRQHEDGGWGESCGTYADPAAPDTVSTASQTAWALIGLMHAGEAHSPEVRQGVEFLLSTQNEDGYWDENLYTGTGFPKVFYLRYHMYCKNFPLWALSMYGSIMERGRTRAEELRLANRQKGVYKRLVG